MPHPVDWVWAGRLPYRLGRTLRFHPESEQVINDDEANTLLRDADRGYRALFVIPDK